MAVQDFQIQNLESELTFLNIICFSCSTFQGSFSLDLISKTDSPFSQLEVLKYTTFAPSNRVDVPTVFPRLLGWP